MQLGIDPTNKVITIYSDVNLRDLFETLSNLNIDLNEWELEPFAEKQIVKEYIYLPVQQPYFSPGLTQPHLPNWNAPIVWCSSASDYININHSSK